MESSFDLRALVLVVPNLENPRVGLVGLEAVSEGKKLDRDLAG